MLPGATVPNRDIAATKAAVRVVIIVVPVVPEYSLFEVLNNLS